MATMKCEAMLLMLLMFFSAAMAMEHEGGHVKASGGMFLLRHFKQVVKTEAGEMKVIRGYRQKTTENPMHIGFINMDAQSLFIPQYVDSNLIFFVRKGQAKIGSVHKNELMEKELKSGDIYRISAGSAFYIVNVGEGQALQMICSIDTSESMTSGPFQSFFVGGGSHPASVLSGFDHKTLSTAFNVSSSELQEMLNTHLDGPIIKVTNADQANKWASFMQLKHKERQAMNVEDENEEEEEVDEEEYKSWSWRKVLKSVLGEENKSAKTRVRSSAETFNLYEKKPDYKNNYGWSVALDKNDYAPLSRSGISLYLVNLTAGAMLAPHLNPTATEYGIVLKGSGTIQIVYPNGTSAMNAEVKEGDVFWVPRYFAFCQIASHNGAMAFFGFTNSARENHPQFLAGAGSLLRSITGPEIATTFGVSEKKFTNFVNAQSNAVILPPAAANAAQQKKTELATSFIRSIEMV